MAASGTGDTFLWNPALGKPDAWRWSPASGPWWTRLLTTLESGGISNAALDELSSSTRLACGLLPSPAGWKSPVPFFAGVVVGSVQSGKTQHMMALAARAFDNGYRVAIVLAGQTNDLRTQTARRFNGQLGDFNERVVGQPSATTLGGVPGPRSSPTAFCLPYSADAHEYNMLAIQLRRELTKGGHAIIVIKKHPASLARVGEALRSAASSMELPVVVLDDECDDASVPGSPTETVVPGAIVSLLGSGNETLRFAYLGYTATAAANLLQDTASPLYPQVVHLMRAPGRASTSMTYEEANPDKWYCGSEVYFEQFGDVPGPDSNFLVDTRISSDDLDADATENASLREAVRGYLLAGAFRLCLEAGSNFAHSMMVHTSQAMDDHRRYAEALQAVFGASHDERGMRFDPAKVTADFNANEQSWRTWFERFTSSRLRVAEIQPHAEPLRPLSWGQVTGRLAEAISRTRLKVVNSDDESADRLDFNPTFGADGSLRPPVDQFVMVIGGARLSRGITIEGLAISYFARDSAIRYEDALLQMNRWFGYRSPYLDFCRVFTTPKAYGELRQMAENDELLRTQLYDLMTRHASPAEAGLVLRSSPYSKPTAKIGKGQEVAISFSPFTKVLGRAETGTQAAHNEQVAADYVRAVMARSPRSVRSGTGHELGIVGEGWTAQEAAEWMDRLSFEAHNPRPHAELHGATYRAPDASRPLGASFDLQSDPYLVSAYLRAWAADSEHAPAPSFNLAISFGSQPPDPPRFAFALTNRQLAEDGQMLGGWTGRSEHWPGDIFFDTYRGGPFPMSRHREAGQPALLLLYLVHRTASGRGGGQPAARPAHAPFFGLVIPAGGPQVWRTITPGGVPLARHR